MEINEQEKENLIKELVEMGQADWETTIETQKRKDPLPLSRLGEVRKANTSRLKEIVEKYGWPGKSLVGQAASHWAWYTAQHSDHDLPFQEKCLELMRRAPEDEIDLYDLAYLTDRVLVNRGELQLYGTQLYRNQAGDVVPRPSQEPRTLALRRRAMGLDESFAAHHKRVVES